MASSRCIGRRVCFMNRGLRFMLPMELCGGLRYFYERPLSWVCSGARQEIRHASCISRSVVRRDWTGKMARRSVVTAKDVGPLNAKNFNSREGGPSFALKIRLVRLLWCVIWKLLASWTPNKFAPWRRLLLRVFGAKIGTQCDVRGSAEVWYPPTCIWRIGPYWRSA